MKLLLDTHILLWALAGDDRLPKAAKEYILVPGNTCYYSLVSMWEVALKHGVHPEDMPVTGGEFSNYCDDAGYLLLGLRPEHVRAMEELKRSLDADTHKDPFDRMLIAQAKAENMIFLTHDQLLAGYLEDCVRVV